MKVNTFTNISLRAGDLVFLEMRDSPAEKVLLGRRRNKLDPKPLGPFVVITNHGHTLDIDVNGILECMYPTESDLLQATFNNRNRLNLTLVASEKTQIELYGTKTYLCKRLNSNRSEFRKRGKVN